MSSASYPIVTGSKKGIQLDPRTKLLLLLTITTLMFSTSNEGIIELGKAAFEPCPIYPDPLRATLSDGGKVPDFVRGLLCAGAGGADLGKRAPLLCSVGGHIHQTRLHPVSGWVPI